MRAILILALFGVAFASQQSQQQGQSAWDIGKTYTYQVEGHALSGLRVDQHGGLQLKYKVKLTRQGQNQYYLQPKDFQVVSNCLQSCQPVPNRPIPQSLLQYLEAPIQFSMTPQGKLNSIRFPHTIPHWAMNFKKAQMQPFVADIQYPGTLSRAQQQQPEQSKQQQQEKTVYGDCKVAYFYEQFGQEHQRDQEDKYAPAYQLLQQQQDQQPKQGWISRVIGGNNDDEDQDSSSQQQDSSSASQEQQYQQRQGGRQQQQQSRQQQQQQQYRQQQQQQQYRQQRGQQQQQQQKQWQQKYSQYDEQDSSSQEDNSAQSFFSKLGRKMGMFGSGSSEQQDSQEQLQNQIQRQSQHTSSEEEAQRKNCDSSDQKFQFVKMYKVGDCSHTPNFANSSSSNTQKHIQKRQVQTRYYACGPNKQNYNIYRIERREATKQAQQAAVQLTLVDVSSASNSQQRQAIQSPSVYSQLRYNFEVQQLKQKPIVEEMSQQDYEKQLKSHSGVGQVILFQEKDFEGPHTMIDLSVGKCHGFPTGFNDAISSIDPQLSCVILWEHTGCTGQAIRLERHSWGASDLDRVLMNDRTSAIQLC